MEFDELLRQLAVLIGVLVYLLPLLSRLLKRQQPEEPSLPDAEDDEPRKPQPRLAQRRAYDPFEDPMPPRRPAKKPAARPLRQPRPSSSATRDERPIVPAPQARPLREFQERPARPQAAPDLKQQAAETSARGQLIIREEALQRSTKLGATEALERRMHSGERRAAAAEREMRKRVPHAQAVTPVLLAPQPVP